MNPSRSPRCAVLAALVVSFVSAVSSRAQPDHHALDRKDIALIPATNDSPAVSSVRIYEANGKRVIESNGIPDHDVGAFPNRGNPNRIAEVAHHYEVPLAPKAAEKPTRLGRRPFGVAINGVPFDPGTAEAWDNDRSSGWSYEALGGAFPLGLDANHAHVQPDGAYHYHGVPTALVVRLTQGQPAMVLVGWAADGFPIYALWGHQDPNDAGAPVVALQSSYRLKSGMRPSGSGQPGGEYNGVFVEDYEYIAGSGDLDECGGRFGVTPEFPRGTYHYVLTPDFPFVPRMFRGTPDRSFDRVGPPPRGGRGGPLPDGRKRP